ncbi:hypothetical protein [Azospirillum canadense]|uniref:hypothetical protein n=1 Tax=Azospirillum canadense TaxID=403962 RepID=UPI002227073C|nr:hypothetical protein [Azospirillum canadense]MCW2240792.1 hypothetical protein [Azospirillum canadense]
MIASSAGHPLSGTTALTSRPHAGTAKVVLEILKDDYRVRFANVLKMDVHGQAAFFFGSPVHNESVSAAIDRQEDNNQLMHIPESALSVIYEFARYPADYNEPLPSKFSNEQLKSLKMLYPSLFTFVAYLRRSPKARISGMTTWEHDEVEMQLEEEINKQ